jgi:hypothetical protein
MTLKDLEMLLIDEIYHLSKVQNDDIVNIIELFNLRKRCRKQEYVYKRYFLAQYLVRRRHMTVQMAGYYLNIDHSTVSYGIKMHDLWWKWNDHKYLAAINPIPKMLSVTTYDNPVTTYTVKYNEVDTENVEVTINGNFPPKLLTSFEKPLTGKQLSEIFALS